MRRDKSRLCTKSSGHSKDDHRHSKPCSGQGSSHSDRRPGRHDRNSGQVSNQKSSRHKDESLGAKLMARKEQQKEYNRRYKKIVENPILYLEERSNQIDPAKHQQEVYAMRFFGAGAAEFLELSCSPAPEIPTFLQKPFIVRKKVKFPIPEDPGDVLLKEKCVWTNAQKMWVYFCTLLQFWTDEVTTESGEIMYGGQHRPTNPMIAQIRAVLNPSFGENFQVTLASVAASTSWTQARLYFGSLEREHFQVEPGPMPDLQNPLEAAVEIRWEAYL